MGAVSQVIPVKVCAVTSRAVCQHKPVKSQAFSLFLLRKPQNRTVYSRRVFTCKRMNSEDWDISGISSMSTHSTYFILALFIPFDVEYTQHDLGSILITYFRYSQENRLCEQ